MDSAVNNLFRLLQCRIEHNADRICNQGCRISRLEATDKKYDQRMTKVEENEQYLQTQMNYMQSMLRQLQVQMFSLQQSLLSYPSYSGHGNNFVNPTWGATGTALVRKSASAYGDGSSTLAERGTANPSPRAVSNAICKQTASIKNSHNLTDMVWIWGQFLDHELDLTEGGTEAANMTTSAADPNEDYGTPARTIPFTRSHFIAGSDPREQPNDITSFIDGSVIYGHNTARAYELRRLDGSGKLKVSTADNAESLLPRNVNGFPNAKEPSSASDSDFFLSGDIRANENIYLTSMHTLFMREHNRLCDAIAADEPALAGQDEVIYQRARKMVAALIQHITYNEFIPCLIGALPAYTGYDNSVNPGIMTEFSTVAYRLGHTMLSSTLKSDSSGTTIALRDAFFRPSYVQQNGIDELLYGGTDQLMELIDGKIVDDVRNFLFGPPTSSHLLDLASLNIQRARDHGIPDYNTVRVAFGLTAKTTFSEITSDATVAANLSTLYGGDINSVDPWVGAVVEDHHSGLPVGELVYAVLREQFTKLRDGDRLWYQNNQFSAADLAAIQATRLRDVIVRNTKFNSLRENVFKLP